MKHSLRDTKRHKCHFCLAFCSVFIVVLATLVVTTIVAQGPIVFVSLVQVDTGEIDVFYTSQNRCWPEDVNVCPQVLNLFAEQAKVLNFTQIQHLYDDEFNLAPRFQASSGNKGLVCFIDLEQEKAINVGVDWPYPDLQPDECLMTSDYRELGYEVGQSYTF